MRLLVLKINKGGGGPNKTGDINLNKILPIFMDFPDLLGIGP